MNFLSFIYPNICRYCGVYLFKDAAFCSSCEAQIEPVPQDFLSVGSVRVAIHAVSAYKDPLRKLVLQKSFSDRYASTQLGQIMCDRAMRLGPQSFDLIIPIPLHWTRYAKRGFNQSHEMGMVLSRGLGVPLVDVLRRCKRTKFQSQLSGQERQKNIRGAFLVRKKHKNGVESLIQDKHILFVDDLYTTGATLKNAILPLMDYKPRLISAIVACRVTKID